ncbi:hypothetical protein CERZMDRAFT_86460 [Cercospora zeae-maydis SCOH1-5]|uniref:Uncharacterized protein n=1 Tax=Cercospora zeae-maydis SCOH1-5 TaxID=717836 RepID=A0A6A6F9Q7_9PEZI|nr:hypothetical protein CERZMDRAFT_86460 [Cercospora zeae-maydis SCOH1-5]
MSSLTASHRRRRRRHHSQAGFFSHSCFHLAYACERWCSSTSLKDTANQRGKRDESFPPWQRRQQQQQQQASSWDVKRGADQPTDRQQATRRRLAEVDSINQKHDAWTSDRNTSLITRVHVAVYIHVYPTEQVHARFHMPIVTEM